MMTRNLIIFVLLISEITSCSQTVKPKESPVPPAPPISTKFEKGSKMDKQEFWKIINHSVSKSGNVDSVKNKLIIEKLSTYSADQIIEFEKIFRQLVIEADDFKVMAADKIIEGWVTDDPYLYFRCWLIGQGETAFSETLKNPDYLAAIVDKTTDVSFEDLMYVSTIAFQQRTGKKEEDNSFPRSIAFKAGLDYDFGAPPTKGTDWTEDQLPNLYPKLWAKFH